MCRNYARKSIWENSIQIPGVESYNFLSIMETWKKNHHKHTSEKTYSHNSHKLEKDAILTTPHSSGETYSHVPFLNTFKNQCYVFKEQHKVLQTRNKTTRKQAAKPKELQCLNAAIL